MKGPRTDRDMQSASNPQKDHYESIHAAYEDQSPGKVLFLDAGQLRTLGLDGSDRAYEQWIRANDKQPPLQSD
jgi:hypothetical protein